MQYQGVSMLVGLIGFVCCLNVPVQADPFGIIGSATTILSTVEHQKRMQEIEQERERARIIEDERLERERLRFEMEKQRFEMEMLERRKSLQSGPSPLSESKEKKSFREEKAAARAAERLRREQTLEE